MAENRRLAAALARAELAKQEVERILVDLASRDSDPELQLARALYERGWRVSGWGLPLTDTTNETTLWNVNGKVPEIVVTYASGAQATRRAGRWADGENRSTWESYEALERAEPDLCAGLGDDERDPLPYLDDLTIEGGDAPA